MLSRIKTLERLEIKSSKVDISIVLKLLRNLLHLKYLQIVVFRKDFSLSKFKNLRPHLFIKVYYDVF